MSQTMLTVMMQWTMAIGTDDGNGIDDKPGRTTAADEGSGGEGGGGER